MAEPNEKIKVGSKVGQKIVPVPQERPETGVDREDTFTETIIQAAQSSQLDIGNIESFTNVAQSRDQIYATLDMMGQDITLGAVLETYAEDAVAPNDDGKSVWAESSDGDVSSYVNYLIEDLNINEDIFSWAYSIIKYGDIYIKLFRESDIDLGIFDIEEEGNTKGSISQTKSLKEQFDEAFNTPNPGEGAPLLSSKETLQEAVKVKVDSKNDHFVHFVEMVPNPAECFELTRFGKTQGFIKAPINSQSIYDKQNQSIFSYLKYKVKHSDVEVYGPTDFVHAYLLDKSNRTPEQVSIYLNDADFDADKNPYVFSVRRGASMLSNVFKTWRELCLLENAVMLSRVTRSSIVRVLNVDTGDMSKEAVGSFIERLKAKLEQKSALNTDVGMAEYTNPGPIENIIYVPTHNGQGTITAQAIGGDVDPKQLTDLEYYRDRLFSGLRVPKQYFGFTGDSAGFDAGKSLTIINGRYAKTIIRIQKTLCNLVKDIINNLLYDKGLDRYINNFTIKMQRPTTQDDIDKRLNNDTRIRFVSEVSNLLGPDLSQVKLLKVKKQLLSTIINDPAVITILEDEIKRLEDAETEVVDEQKPQKKISGGTPAPAEEPAAPMPMLDNEEAAAPVENQTITEPPVLEQPAIEETDSYMPSPAELQQNMVDNIKQNA